MPFPAAGLRQIVSRETFVPTIALLRKADKPRQNTAGAASRQRQPMHPPALRMAKKHRIRKDEAHRTRPVRLVGIQPLPRPAAMPKQARLRTRNPLRCFRIQPLFAIRSGGMRPRTAEGGRVEPALRAIGLPHAGQVERGDEAVLGGSALLPEVVLDAQLVGVIEQKLVLVVGDALGKLGAAVERRRGSRVARLRGRPPARACTGSSATAAPRRRNARARGARPASSPPARPAA